MKITTFSIQDKEGAFTTSQIYAKYFSVAWNAVISLNPNAEQICRVKNKRSISPLFWGEFTNEIKLNN